MTVQQQETDSIRLLNAPRYSSVLQDPQVQQDGPFSSSEASLEPAKEQQPVRYPARSRYWGGGWAAELASVIFSVLCVITIVVILSRLDGRLLSSWTIAVSPNAVIAVLSTATRAAMIFPVAESISQLKWLYPKGRALELEHLQTFDDASRGVWGALKLLWFARKAPSITYLGCLVTIAAIAVGPFTQQILSFDQRAAQVPGVQSSVTRSLVYDNGRSGLSGVGNVISSTRDGPLQAAAVSGIYDLVSPPPFSCPGFNCTYPAFTSLGVCSEYSDVTAQTVKSCETPKDRSYIQICNFTMPRGFSAQAFATLDAHSGFQHTTLNITVNQTGFSGGFTSLVTIGMIRFAKGDLENGTFEDTSWPDTLAAYEYSYYPCARAYSDWTSVNGTVVPGATQESRLNQTGMGPVVSYTALEKGFPINTTYMINMLDLEAMQSALFTVYGSNAKNADSISFTAGLYNSPNITRTVENIATGMSYRMLWGPNATAVFGEVFAVQTYMRIHWFWLLLTVALEVCTCLFLVSVIIATSRAGQRAWKSSLAPLLYNDVMISSKTEPAGGPGDIDAAGRRSERKNRH